MTQIISVDAGNGGTNAILHKEKRNKQIYFPSVRATVTGKTLGFDEGEIEVDYVDWYGHRFAVGDEIVKNNVRRGIERHRGATRYGNEFHQFLVANAIQQLNIRAGEVDLTLFAPPGMFMQARESIMNAFCGDGQHVIIQGRKDKKPREWSYSNVTVLPEGIGAVFCIALDEDGNPNKDTDLINGNVLILDSGTYTFDSVLLQHGKFNPETLQHATWEDGGLAVNVLQPILNILKDESADFQPLTTDDIDLAIRNGLDGGDWYVRSGGKAVNIQDLVSKYAARFAEWTANNIIDGQFNGLRGIKSAIPVGGGAILIEDYLREWYGDKMLVRSKTDELKKIHPVYMNVEGGIRHALMRQNQQKKTRKSKK